MPPALSPPPLPGDRVGPYLLLRPLGVGGMASVYEARGPDGRRAAVKILHPGRAGTEEERRFKLEVERLRSIDHPGVVRVLDAGRAGAYPWMALELVDGSDLDQLIARWRREPPPDRFARVDELLRGVCAALGAVHARGLIHRDLKPANVLLTRDGRVKLTDFGLARADEDAAEGDGTIVGTPVFMAPEQILGGAIDARTDLFALGGILYLLLTGELPFAAEAAPERLARRLADRPRPPSEIDPRVPPRLERVCLRLLERDPAARPASVHKVLKELDRDETESRPPLRGRAGPLARLLERVGALAGGQGGVVVVVGPAGSGRSALLAELAARVRAGGQDLALCSGELEDPLAALADQLPEPGQAPGATLDAIGHLARRARGRPWVFVVDDLDRLTPTALESVTALARERLAVEGDPLLLIVSVADEHGRAAPFCTGESTGLTPASLRLEPLDEAALAELGADRGLPSAVARSLARRLLLAGAGQPGEAQARLSAMERAGWLVRADNGALLPARGLDWTEGRPLPEPTAPTSPLAGLRGAAREAAGLLAALDGQAPLALLRAAGGSRAEQGVRGLEALGFVVCEDGEPDERARALDPTDFRTFAEQLCPAARRASHAAIATALLAEGPARGERGATAADQLQRAGRIAEAWPRLVETGWEALRAGRTAEAWTWARRAIEARGPAEPGLSERARLETRWRLHSLEAELRSQEGASVAASEARSRAARAEAELRALRADEEPGGGARR